MSKFYHLAGAANSLAAGQFRINFHPYEHTGLWLGVYEAQDPKEIEALDLVVKNPKSGVTEITIDQYRQMLKKKADASNSYQSSLASSTPTPGPPPAVPSAEPINSLPAPDPGEPVPAPLDSVEAAVEVVKLKK